MLWQSSLSIGSFSMPQPTTCQQLGDYVAGLHLDQLPPQVLDWTRVLILDNIGCIVGGVGCEAGATVLGALGNMGVLKGGPVTVPGCGGRRAAIPWAAFAGSSFANALDFDDTLYGHPGSAIVPTALAVAEATGAAGADLVAAVVAGYEVAARLCAATAPSAPQRKLLWGIAGRLAPAVAAVTSRLLKLTAAETAQAIAGAAVNPPVSSINKTVYGEFGPTMAKNNFGMAVTAGIASAYLAQAGHTAPLDVFEGDTGWWRMLGSDRWDGAAAVAGLGKVHEILRAELKPYPCCRFIHSAIGAVLDLSREHRLQPEDIRSVEVKTFTWTSSGAFAERRPTSMQAAQFSIPYCAAVSLLGHPPGPSWFQPQLMASPAVHDLADRVHLVPWPDADDRHLEEWLADVTVETTTGRLNRLVRFPLGHPRNPMTFEAAMRKFEDLVSPALGQESTRELQALVGRIDTLAHIGPINGKLAFTG